MPDACPYCQITCYPKKCSCIFWQPQYFVKYCVKTVCPNTHIRKRVCCVLSNRFFLVFEQNLAVAPKNKDQIHFSGYSLCVGMKTRQDKTYTPVKKDS